MNLEYIQKFIELEPLTYDCEHYDSVLNETVMVEAFCLLNYIFGYKEIKESLDREIEENYYSCIEKPETFKSYFLDYKNKLKDSIKNDFWIRKKKGDDLDKNKTCYSEQDFKREVSEFFNIDYKGIESIFELLRNEDSTLYLGLEWVVPGSNPSVYEELQYGMYCFIKNKFTEHVMKQLLKFRSNFSIPKAELKAGIDSQDKEYPNPHLHIFKSGKAFALFEEFTKESREKFKLNSVPPLAKLSFIYRMMIRDLLIYDSFKPGDFIRFLSKEYSIDLDKIKTLGEISDKHEAPYDLHKRRFQLI